MDGLARPRIFQTKEDPGLTNDDRINLRNAADRAPGLAD
jgi:hypothetical protein